MMRGRCWLRTCLDRDGGEVVDTIARKFGVEVIHSDEMEAVVSRHGVPSYVKTKKGRQIQADLIGVGLGISLNTALLAQAPVQVRKGILVNEYLETNVPGVYAAGDVAEFFDPTIGRHHTMGTLDNALAHGRIAGANMAGGAHDPWQVPPRTKPLVCGSLSL